MKTKAKFILISLADLPANTLAMAESVPMRAIEMTKRATRRQVRAAQQRSAQFIKDLAARANAPLKTNNSGAQDGWLHGGLNE